jgi:hypothetical protein
LNSNGAPLGDEIVLIIEAVEAGDYARLFACCLASSAPSFTAALNEAPFSVRQMT